MDRIKFNTDGWQGVIARNFTVTNVAIVADATATWLIKKNKDSQAVVGFDTRFGSEMFAQTVAKVLAARRVKVYLADHFVTAPMVSFAVKQLNADLGVVITAGHHPFNYNGYKLKGNYGGPLLEENMKNIEDLISQDNALDIDLIKWQNLIDQGSIELTDLEKLYLDHLKDNFNLEKIKRSRLRFAFDAMYGSAQDVIRRVLPGTKLLHCKVDPLFNRINPEPLERNLTELIKLTQSSGNLDCGMAVDGTGDRLALIDNHGNYIDSHHIILILIHYLVNYKSHTGKIVTGFSSTARIEKLCDHYGLEVIRSKNGFRDICRIMLTEDILLAGEESGGIAVKGYLPDRDGIWAGLLIWQFMVETGKSLKTILKEVYSITGKFACQSLDISVTRDQKTGILEKCEKGYFNSFGPFRVIRTETLDGYKYFFSPQEWILIKPSGTESILRCFAESDTRENAEAILNATRQTILTP